MIVPCCQEVRLLYKNTRTDRPSDRKVAVIPSPSRCVYIVFTVVLLHASCPRPILSRVQTAWDPEMETVPKHHGSVVHRHSVVVRTSRCHKAGPYTRFRQQYLSISNCIHALLYPIKSACHHRNQTIFAHSPRNCIFPSTTLQWHARSLHTFHAKPQSQSPLEPNESYIGAQTRRASSPRHNSPTTQSISPPRPSPRAPGKEIISTPARNSRTTTTTIQSARAELGSLR